MSFFYNAAGGGLEWGYAHRSRRKHRTTIYSHRKGRKGKYFGKDVLKDLGY